MSDPTPRNPSECPETHAGGPPPPTGRAYDTHLRPGWYIRLFPADPGADAAAAARDAAAVPAQLELPAALEFFDPRQTEFQWPAGGAEGGAN